MKIKMKELRAMVVAAIARQEAAAAILAPNKDWHANYTESWAITQGRAEAYRAVIQAIDAPRASACFDLRTDGSGLFDRST